MDAPTFYHNPVLLEACIDGLAIRAGGVYVDATYGGGGHSRAILDRIGDGGRLIAFDQDSDAWASAVGDQRLTPVHENFRYVQRFLRLYGHPQVDGILADLGVSSHQFDTGARGFSTRFDGPMDMRMDVRSELTAETVLRTSTETDLHRLFEQFGEVRNSRELAKHISANRRTADLSTIAGFKALIAPVVKGLPQRYYAQVFQALRIAVNSELEVLKDFLRGATASLASGGRLCVISFHSLEDRIVKEHIRAAGDEAPEDLLRGEKAPPPLRMITKKPVEPGADEIKKNPRARSAKLRIAEKV